MRRTALLVAALAVVAAACEGTWTRTASPSPVRAVHAALLRTGKVLLIAGSGNSRAAFDAGSFTTAIYDPATDTVRADVATPYDLFCAGHAFLPDGRLLVAGGTAAYDDAGLQFAGERRTAIFDPVTETYSEGAPMAIGRWYPTVVNRGDGTLVAVAGWDDQRHHSNTFQVYDAASGAWSSNRGIGTNDPNGVGLYSPTYPSLHLLADGRLFYSGAHVFPAGGNTSPYLWDPAQNSITWLAKNAAIDVNQRDQAASVLLPPAQDQRVLVIGGGHENGAQALATTALIDLRQPNPQYAAGPAIDAGKMYVSAVILPDGRVLETGGATTYRSSPGSAPVHSTQILDPTTMTWSKAPDARVDRSYHSGALLLPDGRVLTFGGNPGDGSFRMDLELYSPSYMTELRPTITRAPTNVGYGDSFAVETDAPVHTAVLIRPSAVTHSSDSDQRSVDLGVKAGPGGTRLTVPANPNLTPPGWYMLFVRDAAGVPSVAHWVRIG